MRKEFEEEAVRKQKGVFKSHLVELGNMFCDAAEQGRFHIPGLSSKINTVLAEHRKLFNYQRKRYRPYHFDNIFATHLNKVLPAEKKIVPMDIRAMRVAVKKKQEFMIGGALFKSGAPKRERKSPHHYGLPEKLIDGVPHMKVEGKWVPFINVGGKWRPPYVNTKEMGVNPTDWKLNAMMAELKKLKKESRQ